MKSLLKCQDMWAILALAAWTLAYHFPVTIGEQVFSEGDIVWIYLPVRFEVTRALAEGRLPLWTPLVQAGLPLLAEGHSNALYPVNLVLHSIFPPPLATSYVILFNLIWVAIGMYCCVRAAGLRVSSSLLAGLAFGASGAVIARVSHLDVLTAISWLPWMIFFQVKYWRTRFAGHKAFHWFALGCLAIGMQFLAGSPAIAVLNLTAFVSCGFLSGVLWRPWASCDRNTLISALSNRLGEVALVTVGSVIVGLGLGAAQLLPTAELIGLSIRGQELGKEFFTSYSLDPAGLAQFIAPFAPWGPPSADNMEFWGYFGILSLTLALAAPLLRRDFQTWFFVLFAAISISFALGGSNPFYELLYYLPLLNRFRVPARYLILFLFAALFLAALAFDKLQDRLRDGPRKNVLASIGIVSALVVMLGVILLSYNRPIEFWMEAWQWLPIVLWVSSIFILCVSVVLKMSRLVFQTLVIGLTCLDLGLFGAPFLSTLDRTTTASDLAVIPRTALAMNGAEPIARSLVMKFPSVTSAAVRATMWSGMPMTYGRAGIIRGYMPFSLAIARNEEYIKNMSLSMRNLLGIRYYLLPLEIAPPETKSPFDEGQPADGLTVELLANQLSIPPTRVQYLRVVSYTDQSAQLPDGFLAGEITLTFLDGSQQILPIRLGIETADWAYKGIKQTATIKHSEPSETREFPAYLRSVGREFAGIKTVARLPIPEQNPLARVIAIGVRSFLPGSGLTVEHVDLVDDQGKTASLSSLLRRNDLALAFRSDTAAMWDNQDVMPRAFIVHTAETVSPMQALERIKSQEFDPYQTVLLEDALPVDLLSHSASVSSAAEIVHYESDRVTIHVKMDRAGYLVLADVWYPGWIATIDKVDAPILRADYMFRALRIPPGEHRVEFEYRPSSFVWGVGLSAASLLVLLLLGGVRWSGR